MEFVDLNRQEGGALPVAPQTSLYWVFLGLGFVSSLLALTTLVSFVRMHYYTKDWTIQEIAADGDISLQHVAGSLLFWCTL